MTMTAHLLVSFCIMLGMGSGHSMMQNDIFEDGKTTINRSKQNRLERGGQTNFTISLENFAIGDYSRLKYTIRMNRPGKYKLGEPIFICGYVKNMSDSEVCVYTAEPIHLFSADIVSLKDADKNEVSMTSAARLENEWLTQNKDDTPSIFLKEKDVRFFKFLKPYEEIELKPGSIVLNHYFDITRPGIYCLTFHRITFHEKQRYDEPLASNTLYFEVLAEPIRPEDLRDPGEFNYPPKEKSEAEPERPVE